jgi:hypothetical protein
MSVRYYVYEHWRPDKDVCFYVGKGKGRRANVMSGRGDHHLRVQKKLEALGMCVEVRLVHESLTEAEAFIAEIDRIRFWRSIGICLVNKTDGGEGSSNPCEETRDKMRKAKLGKTLSKDHRDKISRSTKIALSDPAVRKNISEKGKIACENPLTKAKRSTSQKARVRTKEHYEKISISLRGRKLSPEHAEKARMASVGRKQGLEEIEKRRLVNTGKKRSEEFCDKMKIMWTEERKSAQREATILRNKERARIRRLQKEVV